MPSGVYPLAQQIGELSKLAADIKTLLSTQKEMLARAGLGFPPGVMDSLATLRDSLERLRPSLESQEAEKARLQALADTSGVINSSLDLTTVLNTVMDTIIRITGAERGFLMLKNNRGELEFRIARNVDRESLDSSAFHVSRTVVDQVAQSGEPVVTTNAQADPRFSAQESVVGYNLRSIVCVPLKLRAIITGVIYVDNRIRTGLFNERERDLLASFANQAAIAIENARQFQEVTELKNLLDNVFASIASGVITTNFDDQITLINRSAADIVGRNGADLVGQPLLAAVPVLDDDFAGVLTRVKSDLRAVVGHELRAVLPERGLLDWTFNVSALKDGTEAPQGLAIVLDDQTEKKRLQSKYEVFKRMVPPAVINRLNPETLALGGTRKEVSIIFADVQGFTAFSETLDPEVLFKVLNRYVGTAAEALLLHEATVDKYVGDAVMAFFNAPDDQPDHAQRAVRAAIRMRDDILALQEVMEPQFRLSFRIAVHLGEAVVGLVGTQDRLDYTIIGDTVNTAKRLQENGQPGKVYLSDTFYARVKDLVRVTPLEPLLVKNRVQPIPVFELLDLVG
jgi:class 3 adenylate cyclase/GAF domain-containing protein